MDAQALTQQRVQLPLNDDAGSDYSSDERSGESDGDRPAKVVKTDNPSPERHPLNLEHVPADLRHVYQELPVYIIPTSVVAGERPTDRGLHPVGKAHLQAWFLVHLEHPYPSDQDRVHLESISSISDYQCMLWFSNTRRRNKKLLSVLDAQIKVLKRWFIRHLDHPLPAGAELEALEKEATVSSEVILDWMREARNLFRRFYPAFAQANPAARSAPASRWVKTGVERAEIRPMPSASEGSTAVAAATAAMDGTAAAVPSAGNADDAAADALGGSAGETARASRSLPKTAVQHLGDWFETHIHHPYPNTDEQRLLVQHTGLTETQVLNWLANARRRSRRKAQMNMTVGMYGERRPSADVTSNSTPLGPLKRQLNGAEAMYASPATPLGLPGSRPPQQQQQQAAQMYQTVTPPSAMPTYLSYAQVNQYAVPVNAGMTDMRGMQAVTPQMLWGAAPGSQFMYQSAGPSQTTPGSTGSYSTPYSALSGPSRVGLSLPPSLLSMALQAPLYKSGLMGTPSATPLPTPAPVAAAAPAAAAPSVSAGVSNSASSFAALAAVASLMGRGGDAKRL